MSREEITSVTGKTVKLAEILEDSDGHDYLLIEFTDNSRLEIAPIASAEVPDLITGVYLSIQAQP